MAVTGDRHCQEMTQAAHETVTLCVSLCRPVSHDLARARVSTTGNLPAKPA